jgi:hypothetical protein
MRKIQIGVISLIAVLLLIVCICIVFADRNIPAEPQIQGLSTGTGMNVQGTILETDSGSWSVDANGIPLSGNDPILAQYPNWADTSWGSYAVFLNNWNTNDLVNYPGLTLDDLLNFGIASNVPGIQDLKTWLQNQGSLLNPPLQSEEVQYTSGYNDQYSGVSGQQTFSKSMTLSTGNKIADQSNIQANTNVQYVAIDTGRATRTEDLLLDGASQSTNGQNAILCPFAAPNPSMIPAYCNIEQSGSAFDTTLTSTVTSANNRFIGTDASVPVLLNYNIASKGITLPDVTSSPMIGSVSAYLKVHVQEARNTSSGITGTLVDFPVPDTLNPQKSEDLAYSETSTASGLINGFSKSISYTSQATAVPVPIIPPGLF